MADEYAACADKGWRDVTPKICAKCGEFVAMTGDTLCYQCELERMRQEDADLLEAREDITPAPRYVETVEDAAG